MRNVTLKQLRALAGVVQTGTVTGAAKHLNVTPPAVTLQLQLLEQPIGRPLLDRRPDGFTPTDAGREVVEAARRIEATLHNCRAGIDSLKGLEGGRVGVGIVSTAKYFAPHALGAFSRIHPAIAISLVDRDHE